MLPQSSTAGNFEPKLYTGGATRFYLPLLHDIMAQKKPALVVTLGLVDAQSHLSLYAARSVLQPKLVASLARF